jgi:stage V sporulation protein D (sporulation-specific penicillin-binding protein)
MQARLLLVFCVAALLLAGLMGRLIYIMQTDGDRYAKQILSRQSYVSSVLPYKRGDIMDRNGTVLAKSELQYRLVIDPKRLLASEDYIKPTLAALKDNFGIENKTVEEILQDKPDSEYVILQKNLKYEKVNNFKNLMKDNPDIYGIWFEEEYVRTYPFDTLACDVIGFTSADDSGYFGIEEYYNDELKGTNGREYGYYDSSLNIERIVEEAENGNSVVSTIDANVQRIVQKYIKKFNAETGSKSMGILIMNPNNGEIIAMASNQEYDLNSPRNLDGIYTKKQINAMSEDQKMEALNSLWKNDAISSGYEPGSTFKPFTVAAGLEEDKISDSDTFFCDGGENFGSIRIKCSKVTGHGTVTLGEALMKSCNDALMQIAAKEGKDIFYDYENDFGFGKKTGIDLPGEEAGLIIARDNLGATELATSSFGQSMNVTMIQMAAGFSSLVNGGNYYQPHIVKQIINDKGATVKQIDKVLVKQTVSEQTSELIQKYMYQTVEEGTAKPAQVPGYAIGGKTGTAEKYPRGNGKYLVSFLGAAPAINPQMVIYIVIDEPQNVVRQDDSSLATKLANKILKEILPVMGIYPEGEIDYLLNPENENGSTTDNTTSKTGNTAGQEVNNQGNSQNSGNTENNSTQSQDAETPKSAGDTAAQDNSNTENNANTVDGPSTSDAAADTGTSGDTP